MAPKSNKNKNPKKQVNEYEQLRLENIKNNDQVLHNFGVKKILRDYNDSKNAKRKAKEITNDEVENDGDYVPSDQGDASDEDQNADDSNVIRITKKVNRLSCLYFFIHRILYNKVNCYTDDSVTETSLCRTKLPKTNGCQFQVTSNNSADCIENRSVWVNGNE